MKKVSKSNHVQPTLLDSFRADLIITVVRFNLRLFIRPSGLHRTAWRINTPGLTTRAGCRWPYDSRDPVGKHRPNGQQTWRRQATALYVKKNCTLYWIFRLGDTLLHRCQSPSSYDQNHTKAFKKSQAPIFPQKVIYGSLPLEHMAHGQTSIWLMGPWAICSLKTGVKPHKYRSQHQFGRNVVVWHGPPAPLEGRPLLLHGRAGHERAKALLTMSRSFVIFFTVILPSRS